MIKSMTVDSRCIGILKRATHEKLFTDTILNSTHFRVRQTTEC